MVDLSKFTSNKNEKEKVELQPMFVTKFCPAFNNIRPKIFRVVTNFFNDKKNYIIFKIYI